MVAVLPSSALLCSVGTKTFICMPGEFYLFSMFFHGFVFS